MHVVHLSGEWPSISRSDSVMKRVGLAVLAAVGSVLVLAPAPAQAGAGQGTDIDWFWNSGDHDAKARFRSVGEHIDLCKHNVA